ncbi:hypothetical protein, partial [Mesorhizobium sp. M1A.F.Ca.IN.020.30.1.1]|uniref:hypothetical protein n=1 Tax=Mesorhizobium sp. M1A.F.Ca.IN.020.30.1.1 TaxID=2496762 RepID=UPI0019D4ED05
VSPGIDTFNRRPNLGVLATCGKIRSAKRAGRVIKCIALRYSMNQYFDSRVSSEGSRMNWDNLLDD